jgi:hypothetical protein
MIFLFFFFPSMSQKKDSSPTKEEMKKMMEKAILDLPPAEREKMRKQLDANFDKAMATAGKHKAAENKKTLFFPARNEAVLNTLPKQVMQGASLQACVKKIYAAATAQLTPKQLQEINKLAAGKKPLVLNQLAVTAFLFQKNPLAGYVLGALACDVPDPGPLELNNLAAMLQLGCWPQKAIPILQFIDAKYPGSPLIYNNLGQAYALLGDKEKSKFYLLACLKMSPLHPEANNTMAHLEASNNNMPAAAGFVSNSLKGGFNNAAEALEGKLPAKDRKPLKLDDVDLPDAFNEYKITLPPSLLTIADIPMHKATCDAWYEKLKAEKKKIMELVNKYGEAGEAQLLRDMEAAKRNVLRDPDAGNKITGPFFRMAAKQSHRLGQSYKSPLPSYQKSDDSTREKIERGLRQQLGYNDDGTKKKTGIDCAKNPTHPACEALVINARENCLKWIEIVNKYLKDKAQALFEYRRKVQGQALREFYMSSYWGYLSGANEAQSRYFFYKAANEYLTVIDRLREGSHQMADEANWYTCEPKYKRGGKDMDMISQWKFECPVDAELPFMVGKIKFNCKEASYSLGGGPAVFSITQDLQTQQYTLSIGIGLDISRAIKVPGVEGKLEASINQSIFITFDGNNNMVDAGIKFGAGVSAGYGFGGALPGGAGLDEDGVLTPIGGAGWSKDGGKFEDKIGYTISINSGFEPNISFEESTLMNMFFGEKQIHPNVRLYGK